MKSVNIINPYAEYIELPEAVRNPRRTLPILLSCIEAITHYHQYQREELADEHGEVYIETTPEDIEWAFKLLSEVLFRKSDELSGACRKFYDWLQQWTKNSSITKFYARDIRETKRIHPRTLTRYLEELRMFGRLEITGGKKQRVGYEYGFTNWQSGENLQDTIGRWMEDTLTKIRKTQTQKTGKRGSSKAA